MTTVQARDEDNSPVDWWFIYKVPKLTKSADTDFATGYEYAHFDPNAKAVLSECRESDDGTHAPRADHTALRGARFERR